LGGAEVGDEIHGLGIFAAIKYHVVGVAEGIGGHGDGLAATKHLLVVEEDGELPGEMGAVETVGNDPATVGFVTTVDFAADGPLKPFAAVDLLNGVGMETLLDGGSGDNAGKTTAGDHEHAGGKGIAVMGDDAEDIVDHITEFNTDGAVFPEVGAIIEEGDASSTYGRWAMVPAKPEHVGLVQYLYHNSIVMGYALAIGKG
jgi:hypothetical protein